MNGNMPEVKYLEGELTGCEDRGNYKLLSVRTKNGNEQVSVWDKLPAIFGEGNNLKTGVVFRMAVVYKSSKDGNKTFINLYKPRDGEYEVQMLEQGEVFSENKNKPFPAQPIPKKEVKMEETPEEFRTYQKGEMLSCLLDAVWIAEQVTAQVDLTPDAIATIANAMFNKRTSHLHYFTSGEKE